MKKAIIISVLGVLSLSAGSHRITSVPVSKGSPLIEAVETQSAKVDNLLIRLKAVDTLIKRK